jgi:hypothetical protein
MLVDAWQLGTHRVKAKEAVVIAAGAWTGELVYKAAPKSSPKWLSAIRPRKGHLLELVAGADGALPSVKHGLMEIGYAKVRQECWWIAMPVLSVCSRFPCLQTV